MLEGWEWLIIGIVAVVIIMWGPAKIPEFARALGRAKGEFSNASKEFEKAATEASATPAPARNAAPVAKTKSKEEILLETARTMGIETEGKTQQQISEEISVKAKLLGAE